MYNLHIPLRTNITIYHHFTSPQTGALLALFASQAFSWSISCRTRMLLFTPHSYSFILHSTEETIKGFTFFKFISPATQIPSSHSPCTRMLLDHIEHPLYSNRPQITLQDVSQAPRTLPSDSCLTLVSSQGIQFGRTNQVWGSAIESYKLYRRPRSRG